MFLIPISMIALSAQLVVRVADVVPKFDIARGCRLDSAQAFDPSAGMNETVKKCVADEQGSHGATTETMASIPRDRQNAMHRGNANRRYRELRRPPDVPSARERCQTTGEVVHGKKKGHLVGEIGGDANDKIIGVLSDE
jgi:hypothetical protein